MKLSLVLSGTLLCCALITYFRPQWVSTLRHYTDAGRRNIAMRRVRHAAGGGLLTLALLTGPGDWMLTRCGVPETTLTVLRILVMVIGVIVIMACIETGNHNTKS